MLALGEILGLETPVQTSMIPNIHTATTMYACCMTSAVQYFLGYSNFFTATYYFSGISQKKKISSSYMQVWLVQQA